MSLKNEIFEGIAAYKALAPTTQDKYYNEMYEIAKRKRKKDDEVDKSGEDLIEVYGGRQTPDTAVPRISSTQTPGAIQTGVPPEFSRNPLQLRRGGRIPHMKRGGVAPRRTTVSRDPLEGAVPDPEEIETDNEADNIIAEILRTNPSRGVNSLESAAPPAPTMQMQPPIRPGLEARAPAAMPERERDSRARTAAQDWQQQGVITRSRYAANAPAPPDYGPPVQNYEDQLNLPPTQEDTTLEGELNVRGANDRYEQEKTDRALRTALPPLPDAPTPDYTPNLNPMKQLVTTSGGAGETGGEAMPRPRLENAVPRGQQRVRDPADEINARGKLDRGLQQAMQAKAPMPVGGEPQEVEETSSIIGRAIRPAVKRYVEGDPVAVKRAELEERLDAAREGLLEQTTPSERARRSQEVAALQAEIAKLDAEGANPPPVQGSSPQVAPGQPAPTPGVPPPLVVQGKPAPVQPPAPPAPGKPAQQLEETGGSPQVGAIKLDAFSPENLKKGTKPQTKSATTTTTTAATTQGGGGGGGGGGSNGPGGGNGTQPPPPPGANATAPGPGGRKVVPGSLEDQNRVRAFDPVADRADAGNKQLVSDDYMLNQPVTPQDIQTTLAGAMQGAPKDGSQPVIGDGAASRPAFQAFVKAHNQGGRLTPGQAMLIGMVGRYKALLRQGRSEEAITLAWGIVQAANLEAGAFGRLAQDQIRSGDRVGAANSLASAADYAPDGMRHKASADGRFLETYDQNGKLTARTPLNGQTMLQLAMGFSDGSLMWQSLTQVAAMFRKDKDAEGRGLTNDLRRLQIEGARLRNDKMRSGGGRGGTPAQTAAAAAVDTYLGTKLPKVDGDGGGAGGGPDNYGGMPIDYNPTD